MMGAGYDRAAAFNRFCLGDLPADERAQLEERLFLDDGLNEEFQAACDELILTYLTGALPVEDRTRFESSFMATPLRRERVEFVRRLLAAGRDPSRGRARRRLFLAVAAAAVVAVCGLMLALFLRPTTTRERPIASSSPPAVPPDHREPGRQAQVVALSLPANPGIAVAVTVSARTRFVRLEVPVAEAPSYRATIRSAAGSEVWRARDLDPPGPGRLLALAVPAEVLAAGAYSLLLEGEPLRGQAATGFARRYSIQVTRER